MRILILLGSVGALAATAAMPVEAQTCNDQHRACLQRKHTEPECRKSTSSCLKTGRWIGPAGNEFPISKKK